MKKIVFIMIASLFLFACGDSTGSGYDPSDNFYDTSENPVIKDDDSSYTGGGGSIGGDDDDDDDETINRKICGKIKKSYEKIINGTACKAEGSPVMKIYTVTNKSVYLCSGTLIDTNTVLTAGHCFNSSSFEADEVVTEVIVYSGEKELSVASYIVNPNYDVNNGIDTALVKLSNNVDDIDPVAIVTSYIPKTNEKIIAYGYGITEDGVMGELRAAYLKVDTVYENYLVTKYDTTKTSACRGDSGGPVVGLDSNNHAGIYAITSLGNTLDCMDGEVGYSAMLSYEKNLSFILANSSPSTL